MNIRLPRTPRDRRARGAALAATLLAGALALTACGGAATGNEAAVNDDGSVDLDQVTLIVGDQKGGSKALLEAAGLLDDVPYEIQWKEFTSGPPLLEALNAGSIHVGGVGNTPPAVRGRREERDPGRPGRDVRRRRRRDRGARGSDIKSVEDLAGTKVAVAEGSSANYNLLAQLDEAGLKYSDITVENLQPADALAAFSQGHVDAWAIWEPYTSQAELEADAQVLTTGEGLVNGYVFQVASNDALEDPATTEALQDYVGRIAQAQVWSQTHQEDWAKVWSEETGLSEDITLAAVEKRRIELVPIDDEVIASEQEMADAFADNGLIPGEFDVAPYFTDEFNEYTTGEGGK